MREYGQIQCAFWLSEDIQKCSDQAKLLAAYLCTGPHSNGLGCYRLTDGYLSDDLGWSPETISKAFAELFGNGFAYRFGTIVFIPKFLYWNRIANPNVAMARQQEFEALPKGEAKTRLAAAMLEFSTHWRKGFETVLQTVVAKGFEQVTQTEPYPTQPLKSPQQGKEVKAGSNGRAGVAGVAP